MKKKYIILTIVLFMVAVMLSVGLYASGPASGSDKQHQSGKLIGVEKIGTTPDAQDRYEYIVTMKINGVIIYFRMWMTPEDAAELKKATGQNITIYYHWDGEGHRIYDYFKYGIHDHL